MKKIILLLSMGLLAPFVGAVPASNGAADKPATPTVTSHIPRLTDEQALEIGKKIWQNQSGGTTDSITAWDDRGFALIGINQSLWYSENYLEDPSTTKFTEDWPVMAHFLKKHGIAIPDWALAQCPWETSQQFLASLNDQEVVSLRDLLATDEAVILQTRCIVKRLTRALPQMLQGLSPDQALLVQSNFNRVAQENNGFFALVDYVNFKGNGINPAERYQGMGWGLLQVLETMTGTTDQPLQEFVDAAWKVLNLRIDHSDPQRNEAQYLSGWNVRLESYLAL